MPTAPPPANPPFVFMLADLLLSAILLVSIISMYYLAEPPTRGFYCTDNTIGYPYVDPTLIDVVVVLCLLGIPIFTFAVIELTTSVGSEPLFGEFRIPNGVLRWFDVTSTYLFGAGVSQITCDSAKYIIGRLRPHFLAVCQPNVVCDAAAVMENKYITEYTCLGENLDIIREARLSFPSGFTAFAFYAAVYTVIYLQYNFIWNKAKVIRHLLQFAFMIAAWYMGLCRLVDYSQHWTDVAAGMSIGTSISVLTVVCISDLHAKSKVRLQKEEEVFIDDRKLSEIPMIN